jgi:hypothetical protein
MIKAQDAQAKVELERENKQIKSTTTLPRSR